MVTLKQDLYVNTISVTGWLIYLIDFPDDTGCCIVLNLTVSRVVLLGALELRSIPFIQDVTENYQKMKLTAR